MVATLAPAAADQSAIPDQYRFAAGARERFAGTWSQPSQLPGAAQVVLPLQDIAPGDFTSGVYVDVQCTTAGNSANTAFAADGPFSAIQYIELLDPQGTPFQAYLGWELMLWDSIGGWTGQSIPTFSPNYLATTGSGATGGSFAFTLRIPAELFCRDGAGTLFNGSTAAQFKVRITVAPSASIYTTPPTALAAINFSLNSHGYQVPQAFGPTTGRAYAPEPPGGQIYQNIYRQVVPIVLGQNIVYFNRKSFLYRQIVFVFRDNTGARVNTIAVNNHNVKIDNVDVFNGTFRQFRQITWERNRWQNGVTDMPAGVLGLSWCYDMDGTNGGETRDQYVPTQPGSICEYRFDAAAAGGTLTILYNDVSLTDEAVRLGMMKV